MLALDLNFKQSKQMSNNVKKPSIKSLKIKERIETMARDYNLPGLLNL
jgi:hypothetical protein